MKMIVYELDSSICLCGPHRVDVSFVRHYSSEFITSYEIDSSRVEPVKEGFRHPTDSVVENDEVIAHVLQEELSRFEYAEASESTTGKQLQVSILDGPVALPEIDYESTLDGLVSKRLNHMTPVPQIPKINGELSSADEATSDHQRLLKRLQLYELVELKISGDGNCQFRSLSDQIYRTPEHHKFVREQVINQLKSRPELYENYVPMAYTDYLENMSKNGEWGDNITLQAAADLYGIKIFIITSFKDTCYIEILPLTQKLNRTIFLSFWAEVHYNSIYPLGELPEEEDKKKNWWD